MRKYPPSVTVRVKLSEIRQGATKVEAEQSLVTSGVGQGE